MLSHIFPRTLIFLAAFSLAPSLLLAQGGPVLISVNQGSSDITLTDTNSDKVLASIHIDTPAGHEVAVAPDGRTAYVPIYGDSSVGKPGTDGSKVLILDLVLRRVVGEIDLHGGVRPHGIVFNLRDGYLYVTAELQQCVLIINPKTRAVIDRIPTGQAQTHMIVLSHDGRFAYTSNVGPGTVSVLDLRARKLVGIIPVASGGHQPTSITPDDRTVITADQGKAQLALIDTSTRSVRGWIPLPTTAYGTAVAPDGETVYVTLPATNQLGIVNLAAGSLVKTIPISKRPHTVLLDLAAHLAYVACIDSGVSVVDLVNDSVRGPILVGDHSDGIALAHLGAETNATARQLVSVVSVP